MDPNERQRAQNQLSSQIRELEQRPRVPRPNQPAPVPQVQPLTGWKQSVGTAVEVYRSPGKFLTSPTDDVPLADLLTVREALGVRDEEWRHIREASYRFAHRTVGLSRQEDLRDLLVKLIRETDRRIDNLVEAGQRWAVEMYQQALRKGG